MESNQVEPIQSLPLPPCRSKRIFHPPKRYLGTILEKVEEIFLVGIGVLGDDLKTYDEAILDIDFEKWLEVMKSEIDSKHLNQVGCTIASL